MRKIPYRAVLLTLAMLFSFSVFALPAEAAEEINYRLKWLLNTSVVGDIYADVQGVFAENGLKVTVKPGGPERDAIRELELGLAQFGVASADQVIRALSKGSPVVVIAQLFQVNPLQWIYRASAPPINTLSDLKTRRIGITYGGNDETIMRTLLAKGKIAEKDVRLFSVRYDYTPFYQKKVDIWPVYRNTQATILSRKLEKEGEAVQYFNPAEFGVHFVANSVVTSREMIEKRPETVKRFIQALLRGWKESLSPENEARALETLQQVDKDTPPDVLLEQLRITRQLIVPPAGTAIGAIDIAAWKQTEAIMIQQKQIPKPVRVETVLQSGFIPAD